ncbi:MAG: ABC transporter permease [Chloroflexi bacterium]|nr:ABC transporter permease [Chloroflexota bacterium]MCY3697623.1 ABC transporter permease [Chloroflexota bacterium]MXX81327.1 FtsX-like permease family protein [Chloroflexota bacterium]MYB21815.1 FtsX-like permease family protein [Chloroflexota bacterium]MYF22804.1 FtsX-like permease family protein [Chloroflexota bacterium]
MSTLDALQIAVRAIIANRLRSLLTLLGLVIGVSSVIALIAVGQGTQKGVSDQIRGLGTDLIFIEPSAEATTQQGGGASPITTTLTRADADAIAANGNPAISAVTSHITGEAQAIAGVNNVGAESVFTSSNYAEVRDLEVATGSFIAPGHDRAGSLVAVLGIRVAETLFPNVDPIGQEVRLSFLAGRVVFAFTVIGVLHEVGGAADADDQVFVPITGMANRFRFLYTPTGDLRVTQIDVQASPGADTEQLKQQISELLLFRHNRTDPDFTIESQDDLLEAASEVANTLSILLGVIGGISLLVGGIGVMNIMLVSVTERTREIGIRRAVGATAGDIVNQFVTEALALSVLGGMIGIVIGVVASLLVDGQTLGDQEVTTVIQAWSIAAAFGVSAGVGLISGIYPAWRATVVDPIAALRNE